MPRAKKPLTQEKLISVLEKKLRETSDADEVVRLTKQITKMRGWNKPKAVEPEPESLDKREDRELRQYQAQELSYQQRLEEARSTGTPFSPDKIVWPDINHPETVCWWRIYWVGYHAGNNPSYSVAAIKKMFASISPEDQKELEAEVVEYRKRDEEWSVRRDKELAEARARQDRDYPVPVYT